MKVIQARRERQDKISKLMGEYLLKGYKMLGECCDLCGVSDVFCGGSLKKTCRSNVFVKMLWVFLRADNSTPEQTTEKLLCLMSGAGLRR